jgi:hypothetical protein
VNDEVTLTVYAAFVRDNDDMGQTSCNSLRNQIAGAVVFGGAVLQFCAAPMVDIAVGAF